MEDKNLSQVSIDTKRLRVMVGVLGLILPWLVVLITWSWPESISITYYSLCAVGTFMVILGSAGILLISYKGYDWRDDLVSTVAGVAGIGICLFPMTYPKDPSIIVGAFNLASHISNIMHCFCAAIFFIALAFMSFCLFTKSSGEMTERKKIRNVIYRICGIGMLASFGLFLLKLLPNFKFESLTWLVEMIALFFFGTSWLVKSEVFPFLRDKE